MIGDTSDFQNHEEYLNKKRFCDTFLHFIFLVTLPRNYKTGPTVVFILPEKSGRLRELK